jgi:hypothetical protein
VKVDGQYVVGVGLSLGESSYGGQANEGKSYPRGHAHLTIKQAKLLKNLLAKAIKDAETPQDEEEE